MEEVERDYGLRTVESWGGDGAFEMKRCILTNATILEK